ncbi:DUF488 domain-containing protein [Paracoccus versutus]
MTDIFLRRAYDPPPSQDEGRKVLVDRIWPRGISRETLGADLWLKDIAPSDDLRHWFDHDPKKWPEFRRRYTAELDANPEPLRELRQLIRKGPVTLLYGARDTEHNNAVALRDYLAQ